MLPSDLQKGPPRRQVLKMDPDCAICRLPATAQCECEAKGLDLAVKQAEARIMAGVYQQIRDWARAHAQDYILEYFRLLSDRRKVAHRSAVERLNASSYYRYGTAPHPAQMAEAQAHLKRGIDEDWQASVQRYPEVLDYFFAQVALTLPADDDRAVRDPPLSALNGVRKPTRRSSTVPPLAAAPPPALGRGPEPFPLSPPPLAPQHQPPGPGPSRRPYPGRYNTPGPSTRYGY